MLALTLLLGLFGAASAGGAVPSAERGVTLPPAVQASLVARILDYDRTAAAGIRDGFRVGVVFDPASEDSRAAKALMVDAFRAERLAIAGEGAEVVDIPISRLESEARHLDVVYLCSGLEREAVVRGLAKHRALTFVDGLELLGVAAIALVPRDEKPHIVVHLGALADEGVVLDARLLRLAETVGALPVSRRSAPAVP